MGAVASKLACAVLPTATKDHEEKRNTTMAPSRPPMNTSGTAMSTCIAGGRAGLFKMNQLNQRGALQQAADEHFWDGNVHLQRVPS